MKRPPVLVRVQIRGKEQNLRLWLPLFLLLPLALGLLIVLSPLMLIAFIVLRVSKRGRQLSPLVRASLGVLCSVQGIKAAWDVLCSVSGLRVDVQDRSERVYVSVI